MQRYGFQSFELDLILVSNILSVPSEEGGGGGVVDKVPAKMH